jgi:predicted transcriptional regulator
VVTKAQVVEAIEALPDEATVDDVLREIERLEIVELVERGKAAAKAGRTIPHEEVRRRFAQWLQ